MTHLLGTADGKRAAGATLLPDKPSCALERLRHRYLVWLAEALVLRESAYRPLHVVHAELL